ncbi:hypothetical protein FB446DRAFT_844274 [Lentinula raphanica]|nr:hypothetical protein FB446DRAFT_844274 [Lentinula raphanica]
MQCRVPSFLLLVTESKAVIPGRRRFDFTFALGQLAPFLFPVYECRHNFRAKRTTLRYRLVRLAALSLSLTMSRVSSTPPAPLSEDLPLLALHTSLELSACPPRPPLDADENFLGLSIYPGSMTEVTSQDDLHFGSLGRLFFIIEQRLNGNAVRKRAVFDDARIPRRILESDPELNELLLLRNTSISRSRAVVADTETDRSVSPSNDKQVQGASADAEGEVSGPRAPSRHSQLDGRAERKHAPYYIPRRIDRLPPSHDACQMPKGITVTILAWTKESYRQITTNLNIGNGHCMTLSMVTSTFADLFEGDADSSNLERFVPHKGWFPILLNTPFVVNEGDIISLKHTATQVNDWHIHVPH